MNTLERQLVRGNEKKATVKIHRGDVTAIRSGSSVLNGIKLGAAETQTAPSPV